MARDGKAARIAFIQRIQHRMAVTGLSQQELAAKIGAVQSSLSDQLNPTKQGYLSGHAIMRLPPALGCAYRWLFEGRGPEVDTDTPPTVATVDAYLSGLADVERCIADLKARVTPPRPRRVP